MDGGEHTSPDLTSRARGAIFRHMSDSFAQLPRAIQFQMAVIGPLRPGLVCGFFLGINAVAYWVVSIAGVLGGLAGGADFGGGGDAPPAPRAARDPRREAAARGLLA